MCFEILGIYPIYGHKDKWLVFSCHVSFPDKNIAVRGIKVKIQPGKEPEFFTPTEVAFDHKENKKTRFPVFIIDDEALVSELKDSLIKKCAVEFHEFEHKGFFPGCFAAYDKMAKGYALDPKNGKPLRRKPSGFKPGVARPRQNRPITPGGWRDVKPLEKKRPYGR